MLSRYDRPRLTIEVVVEVGGKPRLTIEDVVEV
jgi:hypothetical protein